jgi:hypothetical protein
MTSIPGAGGRAGPPERARLELEGHLIDSLLLAKVLDEILAAGADYEIVEVVIGRGAGDQSRAVLAVTHPDPSALDGLCARLAVHGARRVAGG